MAYAVITRDTITDQWRIKRVANTNASAQHAYGLAATRSLDPAENARPKVIGLAVLHTTRHVGNFVDTNEMTIVKSQLI